jgi:cyclopropane fatty-acyl-phospholipid synthase-like methyltransferase
VRNRRSRPGNGRQDRSRGRDGGRDGGREGGAREGGGRDRGGRRDSRGRGERKEEPPDFWSRLLVPSPDNDFLEKTACPGCGNASAHLSRLGPTLLKRCRACNLVYVSPRLSESVREQMYRQNPSSMTSERNINLRHLMADRLQNMHREMLPFTRGPRSAASLLEVGSGWGHFLQLCRPHYGEVEGIELSRDQAAHARERFDLKISSVDVLRDGWPQRHDFIVAWELIEHLSQPLEFLRWAHDTLEPGGQLILSTPNYDSLYRRLLGKHWFYYIPSQHLVYFSPRTMKDLLREAGFKDVAIQTSGRSLLRERWNNHNRINRKQPAREQWLQTLRIREKIENQREKTVLDRSSFWKKLWHNVMWHMVNFIVERGRGDQMRVYARKD